MRKWILVSLGLIAAIILGAAGYVLATGLRATHPVGFQTVEVRDPKGAPIEVGIWYPTKAMAWPTLTGLLVQYVAREAPVDGKKLPLIILSHGIAGSLSSHADTALALADAGFVVAAPLHTGDNYKDQSAIGTTNWFPDRARHVHLTITYLLDAWRDRGHIDADKIGIFGFSAGGTTALIAAGGVPELGAVQEHCAKIKEFACDVWRSKHATAPDYGDFIHDPRIKAAVVIAPGAGFAFAHDGLSGVRVPVQLWGGEKDESVPTASNAEVVRRDMGQRAEWHLVKNAGHFSFMVPCGPAGLIAPAIICKDPAGFDRKAFHRDFNREVVAFFKKKLAEAPAFVCATMFNRLCVAPELTETVEIGWPLASYSFYGDKLPRKATISIGMHISVVVPDGFSQIAREDMSPACTKRWCVYYRKHCIGEHGVNVCSYVLSAPVQNDDLRDKSAIRWGYVLHIFSTESSDIRRAERAVWLATNGDDQSPREYIALRRLERQSAELDPATCAPNMAPVKCGSSERAH